VVYEHVEEVGVVQLLNEVIEDACVVLEPVQQTKNAETRGVGIGKSRRALKL
jgi:hypothetical protein